MNLTIKHKIIKLLGRKHRKSLEFRVWQIIFVLDNKSTSIKGKVDNLGFIKIIIFFSANDPSKKMKGHTIDYRRKISNHIFHKGLLSRINKEILNGKSKKPNSPIWEWAKDMSRYFTGKDIQMEYKHMERCFITSLHTCQNGQKN